MQHKSISGVNTKDGFYQFKLEKSFDTRMNVNEVAMNKIKENFLVTKSLSFWKSLPWKKRQKAGNSGEHKKCQ